MTRHILLLLILAPLLSGCLSSWQCHDGVLYERLGLSNVYVACDNCKSCLNGD